MAVEISAALIGYPHFESIFSGAIELSDGSILNAERKIRDISLEEARNYDVWEMPLIRYASAKEVGYDAIAIPVFPARRFVQWMIQVPENSEIAEAADLHGKRIGLGYNGNTDTVWARGTLEETYGLDLSSVLWFTLHRELVEGMTTPEGVVCLEGADPNELLVSGQLDAMLVNGYGHDPAPGVRRLWADPERAALEWYGSWGYFPILHVVLVRESVLAAHPNLATDLVQLCETAKQDALVKWEYGAALPEDQRAMALRSGFPGSAWGGASRSFLGRDPIPYGLEANDETLERVFRYSVQLQALKRRHSVEELFAPAGP